MHKKLEVINISRENMNNNNKNKKNIELVAPGGSMLSLIAAVQNGASAVYIGYKKFSARSYALNFDKLELKYAISYAHFFNVKVYLALNTLYYDFEIKEALHIGCYAYSLGIDGIIIQDIGFGILLKNIVPNISIHGSTQMTCHSINHVLFLKENFFDRVVIARENSIKEIKNMCKSNIDIEVFCHGSIYVSYSGQCFFSFFAGGRSGNKGCCAQPCRKKYNIIQYEKYYLLDFPKFILSPKDLNTTQILREILCSNIHALKIEGRMKRVEYVSGVVNIYSKLMNVYLKKKYNFKIDNSYIHNLKNLYNREFTSYYLTKKK